MLRLFLDALLFTEMVTAEAILHAGAERFCAYDTSEHPVALQLGGSSPERLAGVAKTEVRPYHFDEINLNVGCPSDRVQSGVWACLMAEPALVADCVAAMAQALMCLSR